MYVTQNRFTKARRDDELETTPIEGVGHVGAGMVVTVSFDPENGVSYEQSEPVGSNWHQFKHAPAAEGPGRPS
jgi:hypothetical protein